MTVPNPSRIVPGGLQLTVKMNQNGQPAAVILGARRDPSGPTIDTALGNAWLSAFWSTMRLAMTTDVTCTGAVLRDLGLPGGNVLEIPAPADPAGAGATASAVAAACVVIKWKTANGTRRGKGRTFLPGLPQAGIGSDGRSLASGHSGTVQTQVSAYLGKPLWTAQLRPAVLSFVDQQARDITSGTPGPIVGIQRRRMRP